jgi:ABC-2 type transport system ATP-binding protein
MNLEQRPIAIDVRGVRHRYRGHKALDGVDFQVRAGELHGFVGPNGAGKTTALKLICTLLVPQTGAITVLGYDVTENSRAVRRRLGFMPDHFSMYRQMTVLEYLDFFAAAYGLSLADRNRVIKDVLELTDMEVRKTSLIQGLSRGMQQRVSLARVLVNDPQLLLLDEPASGLDPRARIELMDILRALRDMGKTIFISSHILSELAELCDSVTIIDRGQIRYSGSMDALLHRNEPNPTYVIQLHDPPDDVSERLSRIRDVLEVASMDGKAEYRVTLDGAKATANDLVQGIVKADLQLRGLALDRRHLNQAFMDLTTGGVS